MPNQLWSQDTFSQGELSPLMYAKAGVRQYYDALKTAQNVLPFAQGGGAKRFGTLFNAELSGFSSADDVYFQTFQYLNECVYQVLFVPLGIQIFLEGILIATVVTTLDATNVANLDYTILDAAFRVAGAGFKPYDLTRSAGSANVIISASSNQFLLTTAITAGLVLPIRFTTNNTLPTTTPQIKIGVTYFAYNVDTSHIEVYATSEDAKNRVNKFTLTNAGTGTNNVVPQNTWAFNHVTFRNTPVFDFTGGYDTILFTPAATGGAANSVTANSPIFTGAMLGGAFIGNGGVGRITIVNSTTVITMAMEVDFANTNPINGRLVLLTEPAWSDARGWPQKCSSYQNRAFFANTDSLPNGVWGSAINDYQDFNDTQTDDDNAISYYPTSDDINFVKFIVPYRSITVHTNSGVYSSPLSANTAITPTNFSLQLNESTPADKLRPRAIDNQIFVSSGNDVYSLVWDGINNAYTSEIISLINEQLIRNPVDEAPFINQLRAGSRYLFIINELGSMAILQTLITEGIKGWTPAVLDQYYGNAYFRQVATSSTGRGWFLTERQIAAAGSTYNISGFSSNSLTTSASNTFSTTDVQAVKFTTSGSLPVSDPQIQLDTYYWVIAVDSTHFKVYLNIADAEADENAITFTSAGTSSHVVAWPLTTKFYLEELTFDTFLDCATFYSGTPTDTVTGLSRFNAQNVKMVGDGYGFDGQGNDNEVEFIAHGASVQVSEAYIGFPIRYKLETLPLGMSNSGSPKNTTLTRPKHIRTINFMFNNTIGGTIDGVPIALKHFDQVQIGEPPVPASGVFEMSIMKGWDDFNNPSFTIEHDEPFDIQLLGIFYSVDT